MILPLTLLAQITSPPEFKTGGVFQKDRSAATIDGSTHSAAEKAQVNAELQTRLNQLPDRGRKHPIGQAINTFFEGRETEAVEQLLRIAETHPKSLAVAPFLAEAASIVDPLMPRALKALETISRHHPKNGAIFYYRARLGQHLPGAIGLLKQSIALDPSATAPLLLISKLYAANDEQRPAIAALEKVLVLDPNNSVAHYRLSSLYRVTGEPDKARVHLNEFQKLSAKTR